MSRPAPLLPRFTLQARLDLDHRNALLDGTDEGTQITPHALCLVHTWYTCERRCVWPLLDRRCGIQLRDRRHADPLPARRLDLRRLRVQLDRPVYRPGDTVQM